MGKKNENGFFLNFKETLLSKKYKEYPTRQNRNLRFKNNK